jgi:hypothetical protein
MLNVESEIAPRNFGKIFRESGFVQMKLLSNSDDPNLRGTFRFINHLGNELLRFIGP